MSILTDAVFPYNPAGQEPESEPASEPDSRPTGVSPIGSRGSGSRGESGSKDSDRSASGSDRRGIAQRLRQGVRRALAPRGSIEDAVEDLLAPHLEDREDSNLWLQWRGTLRILRPLGKVTRGNFVRLLGDGDEVFEEMWSVIEAARKRVFFTTYILEDDSVGRRFQELFCRAAERGLEVSVVLDAYGSMALPAGFIAELEEAGVDVVWFNPLLPIWRRFSRLVRNHRKILVVDDSVAFCGGMNASEDYAGPRHGTGLFRDAHLVLEGPCARDLADLHRATILQMRRQPPSAFRRSGPSEEDTLVEVLQSNVRRDQRAIQKALHTTLIRSVRRCYLTSPYFVPPPKLVRDLSEAAQRGVDVRILTAGVSDVPAVTMASRHLYGKLLASGVRVFEMQARTLHAKTATVDGIFASVGSFNLDFISYRRNLEVTVATLNEATAQAVEARFFEDLKLSEEIALNSWQKRSAWDRLRDWVAYRLLSL